MAVMGSRIENSWVEGRDGTKEVKPKVFFPPWLSMGVPLGLYLARPNFCVDGGPEVAPAAD